MEDTVAPEPQPETPKQTVLENLVTRRCLRADMIAERTRLWCSRHSLSGLLLPTLRDHPLHDALIV